MKHNKKGQNLQNLVIGALISTAFITTMVLFISDFTNADTYGVEVDTTQLELFNKTDQLRIEAEEVKDEIQLGAEVSTFDSIVGILNAGVKAAKLSANSLATVTVMTESALEILKLPAVFSSLALGLLFAIVGFALIFAFLGRKP